MDPKDPAGELAGIVGEGGALLGDAASEYGIDGLSPSAVVFPKNVDQISRVVALASQQDLAVSPAGARTKQEIGPGPERMDIVVGTSHLNQVVAVEADDLIVRAQAGLPLSALQEALSTHRLFVPLDPFENGTVGGVLATNASGPRRYRYRTPRDLVIGLKVVLSSGEVATFGGSTVKNVAGYDLRKLLVGSWGTLGVIVEANLRLWPLPERAATVLAAFDTLQRAAAMLSSLLGSQLSPTAIELLNGEAGRGVPQLEALSQDRGRWLVMVASEGNPGDVERETRDIQHLAGNTGAGSTAVVETKHQDLWQARRALHMTLTERCTLRLKASLPLTAVAGFLGQGKSLGEERGIPLIATAHAGNGIVHLFCLEDLEDAAQMSLVRSLKETSERLGGVLMVEKGPEKLRISRDLVARRTDYALMRQIKAQLDPNGIFNPGRFRRGV